MAFVSVDVPSVFTDVSVEKCVNLHWIVCSLRDFVWLHKIILIIRSVVVQAIKL